MAERSSFSRLLDEQRHALSTALEAEARDRGNEIPQQLLREVVEEPLGHPASTVYRGALRETFGGDPPLALVAFDTPGVHDFVFRVRRPVDVGGGSHLIADFTSLKPTTRRIRSVHQIVGSLGHPPGSVVFAGGGRGLVVVPAHGAARLREGLEEVLRQATGGDLETVTATVAAWPQDLGAAAAPTAFANGGERPMSRYAATVSALMGRLSRARSTRERFADTLPPKARRCDACRRRLATVPRPRAGEQLCVPCARRRELGGQLKKHADEARTFEDLAKKDPEDPDAPTDNMIAVLYADGANVGRAFQELDSMARHRALSESVEEAFRAAYEEVRKIPGLRGEEERLLCQAPIRGGDDLVVILPARAALEASRGIVRTVEAAFDSRHHPLLRDAFADAPQGLRKRLDAFGVGIGIAFAELHFPVGFLVRYAEELLASAKARIRASGQGTGKDPLRSALDFLVLTSGSPLSESIPGLRQRHYRTPPRGREPGLLLTERPFSLPELDRLLDGATHLRTVASSQLFALRQELLRGHALSRSFWRYQHARAKEGDGWAAYRKAHNVPLSQIDSLLWRDAAAPRGESGAWKSTPVLDALEVLDLLPPQARGGAR